MRLRFSPWREGGNLSDTCVQPHQDRDFSRRRTECTAPPYRASSVCMLYLLGNPSRSMMSYRSMSSRGAAYRYLRVHSHLQYRPAHTPRRCSTTQRWTHIHKDTDRVWGAWTVWPGALMPSSRDHARISVIMVCPELANGHGLSSPKRAACHSSGRVEEYRMSV